MAEPVLVSVITPVLNGASHLDACLRSVREQTHRHFEHVVLDNASDDDTRAIVQRHAARDPRVRLVACRERLPIVPNWNRAMREMSPSARYCKVIHHDDQLYPTCLARMLAVAEADPTVGIVGAYCERRGAIELQGIPRERTVVPGREVARAFLHHVAKLGGYWVFGNPTAILMRADLVRERPAFYNEANLFEPDNEACLVMLRHTNFGFVHEVLTARGVHGGQYMNRAMALGGQPAEELSMLVRLGRDFLDEDEYRRLVDRTLRNHDRFLVQALLQRRPKGFWRFQLERRRALGQRPRPSALARAATAEAGDLVGHPRDTWRRLRRRLAGDAVQPGPSARSIEPR